MLRSFVMLATGIAILTVVGTVASSSQSKDAKNEKAREKSPQFEAELADATEVQPGVLTERQRIHSRLYSYRAFTNNKTISELSKEAPSRILEIHISGQSQALTESQAPENYFGELVSASDAVILGTATKRVSAVTEDEAFLFSDYEVVLTEVLKNNSDKPLTIGGTITVTRPGGKVVVDGIIVKAYERGFEALPLNRTLVLFLRHISETDTYRSTRDVGTFEVDGSSVRPLSMSAYPPGVLINGVSSLQIIRAVSTK